MSRSTETLLIGSVSSAAAAVVINQVWRPGTIAGAALTPVLVALFTELLSRPAEAATPPAQVTPAPAGSAPSDRSEPVERPTPTPTPTPSPTVTPEPTVTPTPEGMAPTGVDAERARPIDAVETIPLPFPSARSSAG